MIAVPYPTGTYRKARITVYHPTGSDNRGNPTGVTTPNVPASISPGNRLIRNAQGEQVPTRALVETGHPVVAGDMITLPGETKAQKVIDVKVQTHPLTGQETGREVYL